MKIWRNVTGFLLVLLVLSGCGRVNVDFGNGSETTGDSAEEAELIPVEPIVPDTSGDLIPDGVLVNTGSESSLTYLDVNGQIEREIQTPGIITIDSEDVAIAGAVDPAVNFPSLVYHSWQPEQALMVNNNGEVTTLRPTNSFLSMAAAPGQSVFAFSEIILNQENNPHSFMFAGNQENLGDLPAFFDLVDEPYYWALKPVGIKTINGQAQGVWYIKTGWGIGGADLIFAPNRGLYFFDLTSGDNSMYMDENRNMQGISPDLSFAASVQSPEMSGDRSLRVVNLETSEEITFSLDPATDRGAGFAVFSPDNRYAAWLEATGSMISEPYDFHPRVRVGDIQTGGVVQAVEDIAAVQLINGDKISMLRPVGWLDDTTLLIETRGEIWDDVTLLQLNITNGDLAAFASGAFLAFGYQ